MSQLFPNYSRLPLEIATGEGSYVTDIQGRKYLDFTSGIGVVNLGYQHPVVQQAMLQQAEKIWHVPNLYQNSLQETVAEKLTKNRYLAYFCNSGAEANEAALKLARKATGRTKILTFSGSFHGRTFGAMTATGQENIQKGYGPLVPDFDYLPFNQLAPLQDAIDDTTAAVMLELIQGEGGVIPADKEWVQEVAKLCHKVGALLIIDEIQTGIGRTGSFYAFEQYEVEPDIFTLAKGLGNGIPVGAMLGKKELQSAFGPGSHGSTFGGNLLAMAAANAVCSFFADSEALTNVHMRHQQFVKGLADLPLVVKVRGRGLMIGIEVSDSEMVQQVMTKLRQEGLLVLRAGENVIRLLPALTITETEVAEGLAIIRRVFKTFS
jgi:acetylornithine/N-succinyldiaminopimelate aminotransferase